MKNLLTLPFSIQIPEMLSASFPHSQRLDQFISSNDLPCHIAVIYKIQSVIKFW
jgi:hypothetical protein